MKNHKRTWVTRLITPNYVQAKQEVDHWIEHGYGTHYSQTNKQVMIKKGGPRQVLYIVKTRIKS